MARYVKFMRGSPQAYNELKHKDEDTLYFIYEKDEDDAVLYLGNKLIAGGDADFGVTSIDALRDVLLTENIADDSLLVYDIGLGQWTNKSLSEAISVFIGASSAASGLPGLVPAPPRGQTNLFLRSDGTWAAISGGSGSGPSISHNILSIDNASKKPHLSIINNVVADLLLIEGDVIIIRDIIANDKYQHTSYVYDGLKWCAMDGNYSAETVYFDTDFVFTEELGTVEIPEGKGSVVVSAAGKNVKTFFTDLFKKDRNPTISQPSLSLSLGHELAYEVGTTVSPSYELVFDPGSYEFGPDTNVQLTAIKVSDSKGKVLNTLSGTFNDIVLEDNIGYVIAAKVSYSDGSIPLTALEFAYEDGQIKTNEITKISKSLKGYRSIFYGSLDEKAELNSATIRSLANYTFALEDGIDIPVLPSTKRVVLAIPEVKDNIAQILDTNAMNVNILNSWKNLIIPVEGANGYEAINYKVYYLDFAEAYGTNNVYRAIPANSEN